MKYQEINHESIRKLMDIFYAKVRVDENLGAIFNEKIGTDDLSWREHKNKIASFWAGMFLSDPSYNGSPLRAHLELPPFPKEFFDIWIFLFDESLKEIYEEEARMIFLQKAKMIALRFQGIIYEHKFI